MYETDGVEEELDLLLLALLLLALHALHVKHLVRAVSTLLPRYRFSRIWKASGNFL